jgi:hypothetical protein
VPSENRLELVVEVDVNRANASIKSVNTGLSSMEQTAANAARGASRGIDGLTVSMVKGATAGNLLAESIKQAIGWAKEWTIEAVKMAAHEARMEVSTRALAKAHDISAEAMERAVEQVKQVGFHGEDALHTIDRMIIADLDLSKAQGLAKIAKDAAAIEDISAPEALEKLLQAIEFGNARALRAVGLRVNFEKEIQLQELKLGRTLSENEAVQVRYNVVVQKAADIQGAHAAAAGTAEAQMKALSREVHELREAVGAQFQEQFRAAVGMFRDLVGWLRSNTDLLAKFGEAALWVAGILASYGLAAKIMDLAKSIAALNLASLNPYALLGAGIVAAGTIVYTQWKDTEKQLQGRADEMKKSALRQDLFSGKTTVESLRKQGMTDDQIRELISGRHALPGEEPFNFNGPKVKVGSEGPSLEQLKLAQEIRKRQAQADRESLEAALASEARAVVGPAKILLELQKETAKFTSFTDDRGAVHQMSLAAKTRENLELELSAKVREMQKEELTEHLKGQEAAYQQRLDWETQLYQNRIRNDEETARRDLEHLQQVYGFEEQRAGYGRDAQSRVLEVTDARTIEQKVAVEQRKMEIEVAYLERVSEIKLRLFDLETSRMVLDEEVSLKRLGYRADEIQARIAVLTQQREGIRQQQQEGTDAAIQAARENAAIRQANLIRDHNRQIFDSLKQQAGGVFDALLSKSQSVWSAIGNSLKTAILTAIKDIVTSRVAAMLMQLFTGQRVSFASQTSSGGIFRGLGGLLSIGAAPAFGSTGSGAGGTSAGSAGVGSGLLSGAGWAGSLAGLKSFLGIGGSVQTGAGMATTWGSTSMGQKLSAIGKSDAALLAGGALALDGLRRGGAFGVAETTAGGAMIGFKYGGGVGAAIGAAVGFTVGIIRLFMKGATDKARAKVKAIYGVDISDKGVLKQIVDTAKQAYGGDLDLAVRGAQIRELVMTYAMMTGQKTSGIPTAPRALSLVQSGGSLYESAGYVNGALQSSISGFSTFSRSDGGASSGSAPVVIKLDGPATTALLRGEAVQAIADNPRTVQNAAMTATRSNAGRRELLSLQLSPGTLTS